MKSFRKNSKKKVRLENLQNDQPKKSTLAVDDKSYTEIMDDLYGKGNYSVSQQAIKVSDKKGDYYVNEVSQNEIVKGYLVNITYNSMTVFLDHYVSGEADEINYYESSTATPTNTDLTQNQFYLDNGFSYDNPRTNLENPFWGDVDRDGEPYDCGSEGNDCTCTAHYTDHFIFWLKVGTTYNGTTVSCE